MPDSGYKLHADIVILSMDNIYSTIGENMRYFMYKYKFSTSDWYWPISFLNNKIDTYVNSTVNFGIVCSLLLLRLKSYIRLEIWVTHNSLTDRNLPL